MIWVVVDPGIYLDLEAWTHLPTAASLCQYTPVSHISYEATLDNPLLRFLCGQHTFPELGSHSIPSVANTFCVQIHYRIVLLVDLIFLNIS